MSDEQTAVPLRRNRAFRWLLAGSTLSMLGSRLTTIAYPLLILAWNGSPVVAGVAVLAANAPSVLLSIPAGALVDRWDPRRTLIAAEMLRGAAVAVIICVLALDWRCTPLVILVAVFEGSFETFATLAERCYIRSLVTLDQTKAAQAGIEARVHVVVLAGRALGGLFFGLGQLLPFVADFLSFGISILSVAGVKGGKQTTAPMQVAWPNLRGLWAEIRDGWCELTGDSFAFCSSLSSAAMTLVSQALIVVFLATAHSQHVSSFFIGTVLAFSGLGGLLGSLVSRRNQRPGGRSPLKYQPLIWAGMLVILAISGSQMVRVMAVVMAVLGLVGAMGNVELDSHLMVRVPREKLARVSSIEMLLEFLAASLGPALGGILFEAWKTEGSIGALFVMSTAIAIPALWLRPPNTAPLRLGPLLARLFIPPIALMLLALILALRLVEMPRTTWQARMHPAASGADSAELRIGLAAVAPGGEPTMER